VVSDGQSLFLDSLHAGDEPFMLANNLRNVVVLVDKDRVKAGHYAVREFGCDTLLLDDGFQYLPIKERTDIVLVDRESPWGNGFLLPRGMLREPKDHLRRASTIFITKCDGSDISELKAELRRHNRHAELIECTHEPLYLEEVFTQKREPLSFLKGLRVGAISGIARPESFEAGLVRLGAEIIYSRRYADHHRFSQQEIISALARSKARGARALLTTEKDAVRFTKLERRDLPVYFLRVEIRLLGGEQAFERCIDRLCQSGRKTTPREEAELLGV
jgi:tetraacyldisaccharide 4'-kinase